MPLSASYSLALFFIVVRLIIYPWQIVGVVRACDNALNSNISRSWLIAAQAVVVLSIVATLTLTFTSYQSVLQYKRNQLPAEGFEVAPKYTLQLIKDGTLLHLHGALQTGITQQVLALLQQHPAVRGIILDSRGGKISAARGLAKIISEHKLNTYSLDKCMSACTTAFVAGVHRALGTNARLGFHQYQAFTVYPHFDIAQEQAKDIALFKQNGVSDSFLENIFSQSPENMWLPEVEQLLDAGMIHETGFALPIP